MGGVAVYRSSDSEGGDPPAIRYRHLRFTRSGGQSIQRSHRRKTEAEELATEPTDEAELAVVGGYSYRLNIRAWRDDVENPQTYGEQVLIVDGNGDSSPVFEGSGYVLNVVKREAGGMLVRVVWTSPESSPPESLTLTRVSGPTNVADVVLNWAATQRLYTFTVTGLQNAGSYVFRVVAAKDGYTIRATISPTSTSTDFTFVADASGPSAVTNLTILEA